MAVMFTIETFCAYFVFTIPTIKIKIFVFMIGAIWVLIVSLKSDFDSLLILVCHTTFSSLATFSEFDPVFKLFIWT